MTWQYRVARFKVEPDYRLVVEYYEGGGWCHATVGGEDVIEVWALMAEAFSMPEIDVDESLRKYANEALLA